MQCFNLLQCLGGPLWTCLNFDFGVDLNHQGSLNCLLITIHAHLSSHLDFFKMATIAMQGFNVQIHCRNTHY